MTNSAFDSENRFPDCLRMELETLPIQPKGIVDRIRQTKPEQIDLILNIRFGEHKEEIHYGSGSVTFGIKRGELKVELTNGEVPLKNIKLKNEFQTIVETEVQEEIGSEMQSGVQVVLKSPGVTASTKTAQKKSEKIKKKEYQVTTGGDIDKPSWIFETKTGRETLQGLLSNTELATIDLKSEPCRLIATFNVRKTTDIRITDADFLGNSDLPRKKMLVILIGIVRLFLNEILNQKPYLSRQELIHE